MDTSNIHAILDTERRQKKTNKTQHRKLSKWAALIKDTEISYISNIHGGREFSIKPCYNVVPESTNGRAIWLSYAKEYVLNVLKVLSLNVSSMSSGVQQDLWIRNNKGPSTWTKRIVLFVQKRQYRPVRRL